MKKYLDIYKQLHKTKRYGISGDRIASDIARVLDGKGIETIIDYGCGQSNTAKLLKKELGLELAYQYDPAVEGRDEKPDVEVDCLVCTDVLEHIPVEELDEALVDMWSYAPEAVFVIATRLAGEILPNGENAHCTVQNDAWWEGKLKSIYTEVTKIPHLSKDYCFVGYHVSK